MLFQAPFTLTMNFRPLRKNAVKFLNCKGEISNGSGA